MHNNNKENEILFSDKTISLDLNDTNNNIQNQLILINNNFNKSDNKNKVKGKKFYNI